MEIRKRAIASGQRAHYSQLITCGLAWTCPMCGPKIAAERATDIALALTEHHARGGAVGFLTMTVRHSRADSLVELLNGLGGAWSTCRDSKVPRRLWRALTSGWIKRLEVTVGPNGWHPHLHVLVFLNPGTTQAQLDELAAAATAAWGSSLERQGFGTIDQEHGVTAKLLDLAAAHEKVADYVAKSAALELANPGTKMARSSQSRTPLQLAADLARDGLAEDHARWREYEQGMKGRSQIRWSQGLRGELLADVEEKTDQEAADSTDGAARLLGALDKATWKRLRTWGPGPAALLNLAELVDDDDQAADLIERELHRRQLGTLTRVGNPPDPPPPTKGRAVR